MSRLVTKALRVALVLLVAGCVLVQVLILPVLSGELATQYPEAAYIRVPSLALSIAAVGALEVVCVAIWRLLRSVDEDLVFSESALRWVDVVIWSLAAMTALLVGGGWYVASTVGGGPLVPLGTAGALVGGVASTLLMIVMRDLLVRATSDRRDLEGVV